VGVFKLLKLQTAPQSSYPALNIDTVKVREYLRRNTHFFCFHRVLA
jgi:hypothetical protein